MIKSTKHILKYANQNKLNILDNMFCDYKELLRHYINLILNGDLPLEKFLSTKLLPYHDTIKYSTWKTLAYKQASEIVRSKIQRTKKEVYSKYKSLYHSCKKNEIHESFTSKKFSELNINYLKRIKSIDIKNVSIDLNTNLFNIQYGNTFDGFIHIYSPYFLKDFKRKTLRINIPFKHYRISRQFINENWKRKDTIQLKKIKDQFYVILFWEKEDKVPKNINKKIAIDVGYNKLISTSTNKYYGIDFKSLYDKISKKKQGSKSFKKALIERNELINKSVKNFINENFDIVYIEDLKGLKDNKRKGNKINRWSYARVFNKLDQLSRTEGFLVETVDPRYTSQTCSSCGNIDKQSRNAEKYQCINCGISLDADYNASLNILHRGVYGPSTIKT